MKNYILLICIAISLSCNNNNNGTVEMTFSNWNNKQVLTEFKSITLCSIDALKHSDVKRHHFPNIKCETPNRFVLKNVTPGLYIGLIHIDNEYGTFFVDWDSILVKPGINHISKIVNLGSGSVLE